MRFDHEWTAFALDAEYDSFGHQRIANAHNALRASVAEKDAEIARLRAKVEKADALVDRLETLFVGATTESMIAAYRSAP